MHHPRPQLDHGGSGSFRTPLLHIGKGWWITTETLAFWSGDVVRVRVPRYFLCDLASIPWFVRWLLDRAGDSAYAAIIHDYLIEQVITSRTLADAIFREALITSSIAPWKRRLMYLGVRIGAAMPGKIVPPPEIIAKANREIARLKLELNRK